ncbi:MAG TPA: M64 family metallopeptidase [Candidatus Saccharimonadales bacterium]|nr:M64 family metallopeptidase [Candidatus Saccharimonadales bacterium]
MTRALICLAVTLSAAFLPAAAAFDDDFTGATLRVDYRHTGTASEEHFALERLRIEGPWPGSRTQLIDTSNLGKFMVEVADAQTHRILYTRGFASIYGEWETTGEAHAGTWRALAEAVRIPEPRQPVQLRIRRRGDDQSFHEVWTLSIDPASRFVDRPPLPKGDVLVVMDNGDPAVKVDIVVLGDGYTAAEMPKFDADVRRLTGELFKEEPYASRRSDFNVRAVRTPSAQSGISRPRAGVFRDSALGARYNSFDSERYVLTLNDRAWRDAAAVVPYDFTLILVNERKYGGGGIYGLYSTAAADSSFAPYLVIHEFGHHIAGLGDEYFTSSTAYEDFTGKRVEPWEPNVTALNDPSKLKWADLVTPGTPVPTPWDKQAYEEHSNAIQKKRNELRAKGAPEEDLEALFNEEQKYFTDWLGGQKYAGRVGAFEGAMYESKGLYRPSADCIMFTRDRVGFCPVCRRAIERVIDMYSR